MAREMAEETHFCFTLLLDALVSGVSKKNRKLHPPLDPHVRHNLSAHGVDTPPFMLRSAKRIFHVMYIISAEGSNSGGGKVWK
jgi:hypothetical protein